MQEFGNTKSDFFLYFKSFLLPIFLLQCSDFNPTKPAFVPQTKQARTTLNCETESKNLRENWLKFLSVIRWYFLHFNLSWCWPSLYKPASEGFKYSIVPPRLERGTNAWTKSLAFNGGFRTESDWCPRGCTWSTRRPGHWTGSPHCNSKWVLCDVSEGG